MGGEGDDFAGFALTERRHTRRYAEDVFKMGEESRVWRKAKRERGSGASAADHVHGVFREAEESAFILVVGVLVGERDVITVYVGGL